MSAKAETDITQAAIRWIKEHGGDAWHVHGSAVQRAGEPDIDGWIIGQDKIHHLKIEVKIPGQHPSELQYYRLHVYEKAGYTAGWIFEVAGVERLLKSYGWSQKT